MKIRVLWKALAEGATEFTSNNPLDEDQVYKVLKSADLGSQVDNWEDLEIDEIIMFNDMGYCHDDKYRPLNNGKCEECR